MHHNMPEAGKASRYRVPCILSKNTPHRKAKVKMVDIFHIKSSSLQHIIRN